MEIRGDSHTRSPWDAFSSHQAREPLKSHSVSLSSLLSYREYGACLQTSFLKEWVGVFPAFSGSEGRCHQEGCFLSFFIPGCLVSQHRLWFPGPALFLRITRHLYQPLDARNHSVLPGFLELPPFRQSLISSLCCHSSVSVCSPTPLQRVPERLPTPGTCNS